MKFAKTFFVGIGGFAVAAVLLTMIAPKAAHAVVATLVQVVNTPANPVPNQDVDQRGRNSYQAYLPCLTTAANNVCTILFPAVPSGKRLVVEHVSASIGIPSASDPLNVVQFGGGNSIFQFLTVHGPTAPFFGAVNYTVSEPTFATFDASTVPEVDIFAISSGPWNAHASITGYMINVP